MKSRDRHHDHTVLLGPNIAAELLAWRAVTGGSGYVFPSPAGGAYLSREGPEKAHRVTLAMSRIHTLHGFRAAFSTMARESGEFEKDVVELALDHISSTETVRAYDRGERLVLRRRLMDWWDAQLQPSSEDQHSHGRPPKAL